MTAPPTHQSDAPKRSRGRPADPALRTRILEAARRLFMEQGITVSVDRVAEEAQTTKVTLYKHFLTKELLFDAALAEPLRQSFEIEPSALDVCHPEHVLMEIGESYLRVSTSGEMLARIVQLYQSAGREPEVAREAYQSGPNRMMNGLARYLERIPQISVPEPLVAAEQFLSLVRGMEQTRTLLGIRQRTTRQRKHYLESCVRLFLRGYSLPPEQMAASQNAETDIAG